jgi:hypothetical protein
LKERCATVVPVHSAGGTSEVQVDADGPRFDRACGRFREPTGMTAE